MNWQYIKDGFLQYKKSLAPFVGLSPQMQRFDLIDKEVWQRIEKKESALAVTWHTRQGVYRKKVPPHVRDVPMDEPAGNI